jgi:hypothetical protein
MSLILVPISHRFIRFFIIGAVDLVIEAGYKTSPPHDLLPIHKLFFFHVQAIHFYFHTEVSSSECELWNLLIIVSCALLFHSFIRILL